ncbi:hypothetical protein ACNTMW_00960 [Planosporangium sp. 12N6]
MRDRLLRTRRVVVGDREQVAHRRPLRRRGAMRPGLAAPRAVG